jgi:predicted RNA-binding Zn-ribbon protein involved in translation (DUF1610 family)
MSRNTAISGQVAAAANTSRTAEERYCTACGHVAAPERRMKGSFLLEFVLWLLFFVPGRIYANWRVSTSYRACPACGSTGVVLPESSAARASLVAAPRAG